MNNTMKFMSSKIVLYSLLGMMVISQGCARREPFLVTESGADRPHRALGSLEVSMVARDVNIKTAVNGVVEVATLSMAETPSRTDSYKAILSEKIKKRAKKRYGADAVINLKFWPDPEASNSYPNGVILARGEMIRYEPFPQAEPSPSPSNDLYL